MIAMPALRSPLPADVCGGCGLPSSLVQNGLETFCASCGWVSSSPMVPAVTRGTARTYLSETKEPGVRGAGAYRLMGVVRKHTPAKTVQQSLIDISILGILAGRWSLPKVVVDRAVRVETILLRRGLGYRLPRRLVVGVSCMVACREFGVAVRMDEVAHEVNVTKDVFIATYRRLTRQAGVAVLPLGPEAHLRRLVDEAKWPFGRRTVAVETLQALLQRDPSRHVPPIIMAAAAYAHAARQTAPPVPWPDIAELTRVGERALRKTLRSLDEPTG